MFNVYGNREHQAAYFCPSGLVFFFYTSLKTGCFLPIPIVTQCLLHFSSDSGTLTYRHFNHVFLLVLYFKVYTKRSLCDLGNLRDVR